MSNENKICVDCDKSKQVNLPSNDEISSKGQVCEGLYKSVSDCMSRNNGQITACTHEWNAFKQCHYANQKKRQS